MIVSRENLHDVLAELETKSELAIDTETTGLRPYHGDRLFSIAISDGSTDYYFNYKTYDGVEPLPKESLALFAPLLSKKDKTWYLANASFDMAMLSFEGLAIGGHVHDVLAIDRIIGNNAKKITLSSVAKRWGLEKSEAVEEWIKTNHAWEWSSIPGKKQRKKNKFFSKVPFGVISEYALQDANITYRIARSQKEAIQNKVDTTLPGLPTLAPLYENECKLSKTVFKMEKLGVQIDTLYCQRALSYFQKLMGIELFKFRDLVGVEFSPTAKLYEYIFQDEKSLWSLTEKGNPSFDSDALKAFKNPAAGIILTIRDLKSKIDFFQGFLYHADSSGVVHPSFNQAGTISGRFSSSNPNFQNLTSEEDEKVKPEYTVRGAIIPREGFVFIMPDEDQMEYRLMLEYAANMVGRETKIIKEIKSGKDVHQATADLVRSYGVNITRSKAKNGNFAALYGSGYDTLAATIGGSREDARALKTAIFTASPELKLFVDEVMRTAKTRGSLFNWFGRQFDFPNADLAYTGPNRLIQGGCADIIKVAMNRVDDYLLDKKSCMVMTIHDELVIEVHKDEIGVVPRGVHKIMESVYQSKWLPLLSSMEWSKDNLSDKTKGFPA